MQVNGYKDLVILRPDSLMWIKNATGGYYFPKIGYHVLQEAEDHQPLEWWNKVIWDFNCPLKTKLFMRLTLA